MRKTSNRRPTVSVTTYREDPFYPRIARTVATILQRGTVVAPVDVLVGMGLLASDHLEAWRRGRVPALEQVINCNLTRLSRLLWLPLCWMDPRLFETHAPTVPNPTIREAWIAFEQAFPFEESLADRMPAAAWFPAWLLLRHRVWRASSVRTTSPTWETPLARSSIS